MERRVMKGCARIICNCRVATRSDFATQQDRGEIPFPRSDNGTDKARCRALENRETRARLRAYFYRVSLLFIARRQSAPSRPTMYSIRSLLIYLVKGKRYFPYFLYFGRFYRDNTYWLAPSLVTSLLIIKRERIKERLVCNTRKIVRDTRPLALCY